MKTMHDLTIIGAGPAGLTAAIYAGRFRLDTVLLEKFSPGGQIVLSPDIENYPGFPCGIKTSELMERFQKQAEGVGVKIANNAALSIDEKKGYFTVKGEQKDIDTRSVIIASGASPRQLGIKGESRLLGRGVSYCGTCDGPLFKGKDIALIGGGDRAIEEALFLSNYAGSVQVIHRRAEFRASGILVEKCKANPKINFVLDSIAEEVCGENRVESIKIKNLKSGFSSSLDCQGVFIFVGITPNTAFLDKFLDRDGKGFIITDQEMKSSRAGVFACGDCRSKSLYQVISACGEGAVACDSAHRYLLNT